MSLSLEEIIKNKIPHREKEFVSIGGGMGSFCWVNTLRIHGISSSQIEVISPNTLPFQQFKIYCDNSGLTSSNRLRSDSGARPDNIWGFPGYALSEIVDELKSRKIKKALGIFWQISSEGALTDYYTPKAGRVYKSIEREALRIGWENSLQLGLALAIRKLNDGRFAIFYKPLNSKNVSAVICNILHVSLGHKVRSKNLTEQSVSIYSPNEREINKFIAQGGRVVVIGRGIAAAKVVERLINERKNGANLEIVSFFRTNEKPYGKQKNLAGWKLQFFNWPKGAFSNLKTAKTPHATTSPRKKWVNLINEALKEGYYKTHIGNISQIGEINTDLIIDCTGFDDTFSNFPVLNDLMNYYNLPLLQNGGIKLNTNFQIEKLGQLFVTGSLAAGNDYGPVDSFTGQQYAALKSIEVLNLKLNILSSFSEWLKWTLNKQI